MTMMIWTLALTLTLAPQAQVVRPAWTLTEDIEGRSYTLTLTRGDARTGPRWREEDENPPLSARAAIRSAHAQLAKLVKNGNQWEVTEVKLHQVDLPDGWIYLVDFWNPTLPVLDEHNSSGVTLAVRMNGDAIVPVAAATPAQAPVGVVPVAFLGLPRDMQSNIERLTGPMVVVCGRALGSAPDPDVNAVVQLLQRWVSCAVETAKARRPFVIIMPEASIDSVMYSGLLGTTEGTVHQFSWDSAPCGGPGCAPSFWIQPCPNPSVGDPRTDPDFVCKGK